MLLNSHHDTVKPNSAYTNDPFNPHVKDGKLFGLGSNDAGGALCSLLATFVYYYEHKNLSHNIIMSANSSVTGILQSAVDVDKAKNDGLSKVKQLTDGKIDLTDIDSKVNDYLAKLGSASEKGSSLIESIKKSLDSRKGE